MLRTPKIVLGTDLGVTRGYVGPLVLEIQLPLAAVVEVRLPQLLELGELAVLAELGC